MNTHSYTEARAHLKDLMERVTQDKAAEVITRQGGEPVVMVSLSEWQAIQETYYLTSNPNNAKRLRDSIAAADAGDVRALTPADLEGLLDNPP